MASGLLFTLLLGVSFGLWAGADAGRLRAANSGNCPPGWTRYGGRCFLFVKSPKSWMDAETYCLSQNAHLASFHTKNQYAFIRDLIFKATGQQTTSWVGGHDAVQTGVWMWSDGSKFVFNAWYTGEPNNQDGHESCMDINLNGIDYVNDDTCSKAFPFICAKVA